jgi:Phage gp6-like head-tail connector protein
MITSTIIGTDPLTLDVVKKHLNVTFGEDDTLITSLISASLNASENYCRSQFIKRDNTQNIGKFSSGFLPQVLTTDLTFKPINLVTITYSIGAVSTDLEVPAFSQYTADSNYYDFVDNILVIRILESIAIDTDVDVSIKWNTGIDTIDASIDQARLLLCGTYYENRESAVIGVSTSDLPNGTKYLLEPYMNLQVG